MTLPHPSDRKDDSVATFVTWLMAQADRDDPVGDIARDVKYDIKTGASVSSIKDVRRRMDECRACSDAYEAFERTVGEWRKLRAS